MCGLFGVLYKKTPTKPNEGILRSVACDLKHRGPDNYGIYTEEGIGLVHTRLSLLDLTSRSNQPFWDREGRYCLVYNGEIYNFVELKERLEKQGVLFRTTSDTEVLLESLLHYDLPTVLPDLEGMFAFALFDTREKSLVIARDRFGIKPLYLYDSDDAFIFSSEIKAFARFVNLQPDLLSISSFIGGFGGPVKQHTFFKDIESVPPGNFVEVRGGVSTGYRCFFPINAFWDKDEADELQKLSGEEIVNKTEELLFNSVRKHLIADAPVGTLCSGGLDFSLVTAMASKMHNNIAIFHANVVGPNSEHEDALLLSRHLKVDLKSVEVDENDSVDLLPEVMVHYEHPFSYHPSSIPFLKVSQLVRQN